MTDTIRSQAAVITASADNLSGLYTNQNQRDMIVSVWPVTVLTAAAISSLTQDHPFVVLHGYWAAGDGGGGLIRLDLTDTTTAADGFTVWVDGANRRWKRVIDGDRVNVRWFGCTPGATPIQVRDGLRAASLYLFNLGTKGGAIYLPPGIYVMDMARPMVMSSFMSWFGDPGKSIIVPDLTTALDGTSYNALQSFGAVVTSGDPSATATGAAYAGKRSGTTTGGGNGAVNLGWVDSTTIIRDITIDGITIDATLPGSGGTGLVYSGPVYTAKKYAYGIFLTFVFGVTITRTLVKGMPNTGIFCNYGRNVKIDNNTVDLCGFYGPLGSDCNGISCGGWMDNRNIAMSSYGLIVTKNRISACHDEAIMHGLWEAAEIDGNIITGCGDKGIEGNSPLSTSLTAPGGGTLPAWVLGLPTIAAAGSGGTNGTQIVTGTTGTGILPTFLVTVAGNAVTAVLRVINAGNYLTLPTAHATEPVTGAGLTGAQLNLTLQGQKIPGDRRISGNSIDGTIPPTVPWLPYGVAQTLQAIGLADSNESAIDISDNRIVNCGNTATSIFYPATVTNASIIAGGSGGTAGTQTVTGTTGGPTFFTANVTVSGGAITAINSVTPGAYNWPPTDITQEPVTGAGLVGAKLNLTLSYTASPTANDLVLVNQANHCHVRFARNRMRNNAAGNFFAVQRLYVEDNEMIGTANSFVSLSGSLMDEIIIKHNEVVGCGRFVNATIGASGVTGTNWIIDISDNNAYQCNVAPIVFLWNTNAAAVVSLLRINRNHFGQMNQSSSFYTSYIALGAVSTSVNTPAITLLEARGNTIDATSGHQVDYPFGKPFSGGWFDLKANAIAKALIRENNFGTPGFGGANLPTLFDSGMTAAVVTSDTSNPGFPGYQPIRGSWSGTLPSVGVQLWSWIADRAVTIPAAISGALAFSYGAAKNGQTATSSHVFPLQKNGSTVGDLNIASSASVFTYTVAAPIVLAAGDELTLLSDATDATLTAFAFVLGGY